MLKLSRAAQCYLVAVWCVGAAFIVNSFRFVTLQPDQLLFLGLWAILFGLADYFEFFFEFSPDNNVAMTVADAPTIFLVAVSGPVGLVSIFLGSLVVDYLHRRRRPWFKALFNLASRSITYYTLWAIFTLINPPNTVGFHGGAGLVSFLLMALTYYVLNSLLISTVVALANHLPMLRVYQDVYRRVHWIHFATMPFGAVLAVIWSVDPWLLPVGLIPLVVLHQWFRTVVDWRAEGRRNQALALESQQLASRLEHLQDTATAMIASLNPTALLETVSTRLAGLLDAPASWVVLLDRSVPQLMPGQSLPPGWSWTPSAYAAELQQTVVQELDQARIRRLHPGADESWQTLVIIPLVLSSRVLGGICLALRRPAILSKDDRRVLQTFAAQAALAMEHGRLFEELRTKQEELVRSSKLAALGTFAAGIAHEFNNLLAGILGYAQLGMMTQDTQEKDDALQVAIRACLRGRSITNGLLTFARRNDSQRGLANIRDIVEDTLTLVERELAKENIQVVRAISAVPATVCDPGQIAQVLLNLVTNARDAMFEQSGGMITVSLGEVDQQIQLSVADTGCGIPAELLDQIFQPFMTTKGARNGSERPGTGLGLAITYGIVESHNGSIDVQSQVNYGTTVTVRLPIVRDALSQDTDPSVFGSFTSLRILIVDDDPTIATSLAHLLESHGHRVTTAGDGETGLQRYRMEPVDLVISDIVMPGIGGSTFLRNLLAFDPDAQMLVITGYAGSSHIPELLDMGAWAVLQKPFTIDEVLSALERGIATHLRHTT